jgi:electron transfer flavoprotein beta subunit
MTMKILVPTKRVPDTDQKIRVRGDGIGIKEDNLPFVLNPFDAIAVEEALRIRENSTEEVEVVAVGIGSGEYENELRTSLAMGADRAILIECAQSLDPWNVARILRETVKREKPHLVMMGKQAVDDDANQAGQFLAALLDWPQATFASQLDFIEEGLRVARETDAGIEVVVVGLPAVITVDLRLNEPRYASLPSILKARKKPIERIDFQQLRLALEPRIQLLRMEAASIGRNCLRVSDVDQLLDQLRDEAKVI